MYPAPKLFRTTTMIGMSAIAALSLSTQLASAQDRRDDGLTRLVPGTTLVVRTNQMIDVDRRDTRVYTGRLDQDVFGTNGLIAIPRGAPVEMMVRVERDGDLILDLDSVVANGRRYAIDSSPDRIEAPQSLVGSIVGAVTGGEIRGPSVRVPRDSVVTFRLERPLIVDVPDRGVDRNGFHWHDWER
jgi:hypothetical protein